MDFAGKHVWIIGASAGIGRALAFALDAEGAILTLSARDASSLQILNAILGNKHSVHALDVRDASAIEAAANIIPRIDALIYMAGQYAPMPVRSIDTQTLTNIIEVNFMGAVHAVRAVLPRMYIQRGGLIALCGSVAGYRGLPKGQPYSATKAAIANFAESLRAEESRNDIDVRLISPGFVRTRMTEKNNFAMPMMISPEEAADAIVAGLKGHAFDIDFPRVFTGFMKLLRMLPDAVYFWIAKKI